MGRVIAVANQKGGVAKTTTAVNLGIGLAREGKSVLLVDTDPQGSLTASLGYMEPDEIPRSYMISQIFFKNAPPDQYLFSNLINRSRYMRQPDNWFIAQSVVVHSLLITDKFPLQISQILVIDQM